jgi:hypothetical protein
MVCGSYKSQATKRTAVFKLIYASDEKLAGPVQFFLSKVRKDLIRIISSL